MEQRVRNEDVGGESRLEEEGVGAEAGGRGLEAGAGRESRGEGAGVGDGLLQLQGSGADVWGGLVVAEHAEEEAERGERVAGAEVRAEEAGGRGGGKREAQEQELRVRLERGTAAE